MDKDKRRGGWGARVAPPPFSADLCLNCGRPVRKTFSSGEVPELLKFLAREIGLEQLTRVVRQRLGSEGCFLAIRCGVSICDRKEQLP